MPGAKRLLELADGIQLLYVEDDEKLREDTLRLLSNFFKGITVATNGKEALEKYRAGSFDIVISDLIMPLLNGRELARQIKAIHPEQIVIILSAHDEKPIVEELKEAGVDFFIFKPLEIQQFINTLAEVCQNLRNDNQENDQTGLKP
jgi:cyclic di-GMP phosphodiesterase